jgi:tetratricopeptide (TPR) repeat protein
VAVHLGLLNAAGGRLGGALRHFDAAIALFERAGHGVWLTIARNHQANLLLQIGQVARAQQALPPDDAALHRPTRSRRFVIAARIARVMQHDPRPLLEEALSVLGEAGDPYGRLQASIDLLPLESAAQAAEHALDLEAEAHRIEYLAMAVKARWYRIEALCRAGRVDEAATQASQALAGLEAVKPWDMYLPEAWAIAQRAFAAAGHAGPANQVVRGAQAWIGAAANDLPPEYRDAFMHRNAVNRTLLTLPVTGR